MIKKQLRSEIHQVENNIRSLCAWKPVCVLCVGTTAKSHQQSNSERMTCYNSHVFKINNNENILVHRKYDFVYMLNFSIVSLCSCMYILCMYVECLYISCTHTYICVYNESVGTILINSLRDIEY